MNTSKLSFSSKVLDGPPEESNTPECEILFVGAAVDDRGEAALGALKKGSNTTIGLSFEDQKLLVDGAESNVSRISERIKKAKSVRFEATTLGMAEILRALQAVKDAGIDEVEFYYVEPKDYAKLVPLIGGVLSQRDFELTTNNKFASLQGFAQEYQDGDRAHHVYFLGYESSRLLQAFEQRGEWNREKYDQYFVIGVPAFTPGWETNCLANHAQTLKRHDVSPNSIKYCSASSIREAYYLLWNLYDDIASESSVFWISPLGTKPHTVASALFLLETKGSTASTSLFYDHPVRKDKRSQQVARCHFVKVRGIQSI